MKKALSLILIFVLCLGLCACSNNEEASVQTTVTPTTTPATTPATTPTETTVPVETTTPPYVNPWEIGYYIDSFGDPTDEPYLAAVVDGTFSNTAVTDAYLQVVIYYAYDSSVGNTFSFRLLEYGEQKAKYSSYDDIELKIKTQQFGIEDCKLIGNAPNGDVYDPDRLGTSIYNYMQWYNVEAIITIGSSTYRFTIPFCGSSALEEYKNIK